MLTSRWNLEKSDDKVKDLNSKVKTNPNLYVNGHKAGKVSVNTTKCGFSINARDKVIIFSENLDIQKR